MIVSAGWYVALVEPVARGLAALHRRLDRQQPAAAGVGLQRNRARRRRRAAAGLGRRRRPAVRAGGPGGGSNLFFGGNPGIGRMFGQSMGAEASWLLPAALIGLVAGLWFTRRAAAPTGCVPRCCCGAAGCWSPVRSSVSWTASCIRITQWRWRRRSRRWSVSRCENCGGARSSWYRASLLATMSGGHRRLGVHPVGPHAGLVAGACAGWCWSDRSSWRSILALGAHRLGRWTAALVAGGDDFRCLGACCVLHRDGGECTHSRDRWQCRVRASNADIGAAGGRTALAAPPRC